MALPGHFGVLPDPKDCHWDRIEIYHWIPLFTSYDLTMKNIHLSFGLSSSLA